MKRFLLAASAIAFAGSATAADMPARMAVKAPLVAAVPFTWSGCYVGGQLGCNYQVASNWVIGVEGMGAWADIKGSQRDLVFGERVERAPPDKGPGAAA